MADISELEEGLERENEPQTEIVYKRDNTPYLSPDGAPCTFSFVGGESKAVRAARDEIQRMNLREQRLRPLEPADIRARRVRIASAGLTGWTGWTGKDDKGNVSPLAFTPEHVKAILKPDHILEQLESMIERHASFFDKS